MAQFLALITTFDGSGNRPDNSLPQPPLGIWGGGNVPMPTPPMAPGGLPPGIDNTLPGGGPVDPGYGRPAWSPVDPGYGRPAWSPVDPGYGRPEGGRPSQPIYHPPVHPSLPIYRPDKPLPAPTPPEGEGGEIGTLPTEPPTYALVWIPGYGYALRPIGGPSAGTKPVDPAEPK